MVMTDEKRRSSLRGLAGLVVSATLPGCGGGGGGSASNGVVSLQIEPVISALAPGQQQSLAAASRHADGSSGFVTLQATWLSSNPVIATVDSSGRVTAVAAGSTIITATFERVSATLTLRVGNILQAIDLYGGSFRFALGIGGTFNVGATGHYTSRSPDIAQLANWTSSGANVVTVGNGASGGQVKGQSPGTATITCGLDGISAMLPVTVLAHRRVDHDNSDQLAGSLAAGVDARGLAVAVWSRGFSTGARPDLSWSRYQPGAGWSVPVPVRPSNANTRSSALSLAMNVSGAAVAAWQQPDGLFAARFNASSGFDAPTLVDSAGTPFGSLYETALSVDENGNALLIWAGITGFGGGFFCSWMDASSGSWTPAAMIPGSAVNGSFTKWAVTHNAAGDASLVWTSTQMSLSVFVTPGIEVIRWRRPVNGQPGAWISPQRIADVGGSPELVATMDDSGSLLVAWLYGSSGSRAMTVRARRYVPTAGWEPEQTLVASTLTSPRQLAVSAAAGHGAGAMWEQSSDQSIHAVRMSADGSWGAPAEISDRSNAPSAPGTPTALRATMLADGRLLTSWIESDFAIAGALATRVNSPGIGWSSLRRDPHVGRIGNQLGTALAYNPAGEGVLFWLESNQGGSDLFGHTGLLP